MGCAEGRSPSVGSLRVSLRYDFSPLPGHEGGRGDDRKGFPAYLRVCRRAVVVICWAERANTP